MKKTNSIIILTIMLSSTILIAMPQTTSAASTLPDYQAIDHRTPQAGLTNMPKISQADKTDVNSFASTPPLGTQAFDWYLWFISQGTETGTQPYMTLRAISGNVEVWTQNYLEFLPGDPRNDDPKNLLITDEMCQFVADEFNNVIYPTDTGYFGIPADRDGTNTIFQQLGYPDYLWDWIETDNPQRVIIKVLNIRDENYEDPTYPYYTAGFFSPAYNEYYQRNIIHIDCWRWYLRLGAAGTEWIPGYPVNRPFVYESTITHEYQHLIHNDWNPDDPLFMNEGCSMYAEYLCDYGIDPQYFNSYLYTPDNSLTDWGDQGDINTLADYGAAALWAIYLSDHYGGADFLSYFVQAGVPGIEGVNQALASFGYTQTFDDVYHDWRIANLIHTDQIGEGEYDYTSIDLDSPEIISARTYEIKTPTVKPTTSANFGWTYTILGYNTLTYKLPEYGSDYVKFSGLNQKLKPTLYFDGQNLAGTKWIQTNVDGDGDSEWFSTQSINLGDISIMAQVDLSGMASATLSFDTFVNTEEAWDFGFVQVSDDNGATWTSLEGQHTTDEYDPSGHPDIIANMPGYTGDSGGWIFDSMDLTAYAGSTVLLRFRYMTDWATLNPGWAVDNIAINGEVIEDADTNVIFDTYPLLLDVDWKVTLISVEIDDKQPKYKKLQTLTLDDIEETGSISLDKFIENGYVLLVMSPDHGWSDYTFSIQKS